MVLFILPVKFLILPFISTTLELQEILLQRQCCCFLCPVLEDAFSFEIWEDDREIVVHLCKILASNSNLILQTSYTLYTKQVKKRINK